jgi:hypothetical protein
MDMAPVLRGEATQVKQRDLGARRRSKYLACDFDQTIDFDISPGQVCSLRDEQLIRRMAGRLRSA